MNLWFLFIACGLGLVKSQELVTYETSIGSNIQLYCNSAGYTQSAIGWYFVKVSTVPTLIWENSVWGSVSSSHYSVAYDSSSVNLTIINLTNDDFKNSYFCYDKATNNYLRFIELVDGTIQCSQSNVFSIYDVQSTNPALLFCNKINSSTDDDYTWIQIAPKVFLLYTNNSFINISYSDSYAVFDNISYSFLYIYSTTTSAYACIKTSDKMFAGLFKVTQCPAIATVSLQLNEPFGPIPYLASTGSVVRFYCNITNHVADDIAWGYVKKGLSPQYIWSYVAGFIDSDLALVYYNVAFDSYSLNLTITNITSEDLDYLYFCIDTSTNTNIVFIELVDSLSTECVQSNVFTTFNDVVYGAPYKLSCDISGLSSNGYYWIRTTQNTKVLWNNGNFNDSSYSTAYSVVANSATSNLTINNVSGKDAYACVNASNDVYLGLYKLVQCPTTTTKTTAVTTTSTLSTTISLFASSSSTTISSTSTTTATSFFASSSSSPTTTSTFTTNTVFSSDTTSTTYVATTSTSYITTSSSLITTSTNLASVTISFNNTITATIASSTTTESTTTTTTVTTTILTATASSPTLTSYINTGTMSTSNMSIPSALTNITTTLSSGCRRRRR